MAKSNMDQDILKVLFSEQEIHDRQLLRPHRPDGP